MTVIFGAQGVQPTLRGQPTNVFTLQAGNVQIIPAGTWRVGTGPYLSIQEYDPITTIWRTIAANDGDSMYVNSDGVNFRVANQTGCIVGAIVDAGGSAYTSAPVITASSGGAVFKAILGYYVTSTTVNNGGTGYTYAPLVAFDAPPPGGVQASGYATISAGVVTTITMSNVGAGYTNVPNVTFTNDPRDTAAPQQNTTKATAVLSGSGVVAAVVVTDHGSSLATNQTALPTLSFSGGGGSGASAKAIMCWTLTSYSVTTAGSGYSGAILAESIGSGLTASASYTNTFIQANLVRFRPALVQVALSGATITATGATIVDAGIVSGLPSIAILSGPAGSTTSVGALAGAWGPQTDSFLLQAV